MRTLFEASGFAVLAVGLHLSIMGLKPQDGGSSSAGDGGEAMISMQASSESVEALIAEWETPPEMDVEPVELAALEPPVLEAQPTFEPPTPTAAPMPVAPMALPNATFANNDVSLPTPDTPPLPKVDPVVEALSKFTPAPRPKQPPKPTQAQPKPAPKATPRPAPKAAVTSQASVAQKAAGSGSTTNAGTSKPSAQTSTQSSSAKASEFKGWGTAIRTRIERRKRSVRAQGTVKVQITVARTGALQNARIASSSGVPAIDAAALKAVQSAGKFPAAPKSATNASYSFSFSLRFK